MLKEYFAALFHGWVGKMSGPASVVLAFLPILFPKVFAQNTAVIRATWVAAIACFVIANYSAWKYERDRVKRAEGRLKEINEAKPCIKLRQPGAVYIELVDHHFTDPERNVTFSATVPFLKVRFVNDPVRPDPKASAVGVRAKIDYYRCSDNALVLSIDGRWDNTDQPSRLPPTASKSHLLSPPFGIGEERSLDVAYMDGKTRKHYAWNNDNYNYPYFLRPQHLLDGDHFKVEIRLRGESVDEHFSFVFRTKDDGFEIMP